MISLFPFPLSHPPKATFQYISPSVSHRLLPFSHRFLPYLQSEHSNQHRHHVIAYVNEEVGRNPPFHPFEWPAKHRRFIGYLLLLFSHNATAFATHSGCEGASFSSPRWWNCMSNHAILQQWDPETLFFVCEAAVPLGRLELQEKGEEKL